MATKGTDLIDLSKLSPATRSELALWGEHLTHSRDAEVYEPNKQASPSVIADIQRTAAIKAYLIAEADKAIAEAVSRAREAKLSWHTIGNALGVTGEAARQRYAA
jgi:hypothetical protein